MTKGFKIGSKLDSTRNPRLNLMKIDYFDSESFDSEYEIYRIRCPDYVIREHVCDALVESRSIISIRNSSFRADSEGDSFNVHVLAYKGKDAESVITEALSKEEFRRTVAFKKIDSSSKLESKILVQLLLNSLSHVEMKRANNVSGRFYIIDRYKDYKKKELRGKHLEIIVLELEVSEKPDVNDPGTKCLALQAHVRTFTNICEND
ncbi:MAG: hypothetical protein IKN41_07855 [Candidatus Methanomethylophilaceae archaeon]|nr:hypothetical protein [Candidatus Methanomethylophilaceae archaeon]